MRLRPRSRGVLAVLLALTAIAIAVPSSAFALANPGQVELANSQLSYVARSGEANDISVEFHQDVIVVRDTAGLRPAAGCRATTSPNEVRCTPDDSSGSAFGWSGYRIQAGDG